jgi:hypothetical protein
MIEVLKQMVDALENHSAIKHPQQIHYRDEAIEAGKQAIAALESQEPVAWLLTEKNINSLQVDSIQLLINRLKHAHHTDLCVRINGQDEWFQADWLKHMVRATPPQRTWVDLTRTQIQDVYFAVLEEHRGGHQMEGQLAFGEALQAKIREKNT